MGTDYFGKYAASRNDATSGVKCGLATERPYDCYSDGKGDGAFMRNEECMARTSDGADRVRVSKEANVVLMDSKRYRKRRQKILNSVTPR